MKEENNMSESNPMPQLSLAPSAPVPDAESAVAAESIQQTAVPAAEDSAPGLDESQLTEAEKKAIDDFINKVDVTNPDHVLLFGADAQKKIADFSQTALDAVKTQETGEVGNMLVNLVAELKGFKTEKLSKNDKYADNRAIMFYYPSYNGESTGHFGKTHIYMLDGEKCWGHDGDDDLPRFDRWVNPSCSKTIDTRYTRADDATWSD